jgi:hypothetical protein
MTIALVILAAMVCGWAALSVLGSERTQRLHELHARARRAEAARRAEEERNIPVVGSAIAALATPVPQSQAGPRVRPQAAAHSASRK